MALLNNISRRSSMHDIPENSSKDVQRSGGTELRSGSGS